MVNISKKIEQWRTWSHTGKELAPRMILIGVFFCVLLALSLRLFAWHIEPVISRDGAFYLQEAKKLYEIGSIGEYENVYGIKLSHPLFIAILASKILGLTPYAIAMIMNLTLGVLFPIVIFGIIKVLFKKGEIALIGALIASVHPTFINYSMEVQREMPYLFFSGLFFQFCFLLRYQTKWYYDILIAISACVATCFRFEGVELFLFAIMFYAIIFARTSIGRFKVLYHFFIFCVTMFSVFGAVYLWATVSAKVWIFNLCYQLTHIFHKL